MHMTTLKITTLTALTLAFTAGSALAGEGKDCDKTKHSATKTEAMTSQQTSVLSAVEQGDTAQKAKMAKKVKKAYTVEQATALCQEKGVADLQACINYKTGAQAKPKS
jgi:hypothetical protein